MVKNKKITQRQAYRKRTNILISKNHLHHFQKEGVTPKELSLQHRSAITDKIKRTFRPPGNLLERTS